jgi:hypothetical protein
LLRNEGVFHAFILGQQPDPALSPLGGYASLGKVIQIHSLMGAVEATNPEMNDGLPQPFPLIGWHVYSSCE